MALRWNDMLFAVRKQFGLPYWSLSAWLKHKVKNAVEYISRFEEIVAHQAQLRGVDGVVCGHIHHAEIRRIGDVLYLNDGDWVESCSALVEDAHGNMEILRWADPSQRRAARTPGTLAAMAGGRPKATPKATFVPA
jgi:UDP-2,3-diacylglucosamine pyrophosphatase LpxH